jgi:hypothetical protein
MRISGTRTLRTGIALVPPARARPRIVLVTARVQLTAHQESADLRIEAVDDGLVRNQLEVQLQMIEAESVFSWNGISGC